MRTFSKTAKIGLFAVHFTMRVYKRDYERREQNNRKVENIIRTVDIFCFICLGLLQGVSDLFRFFSNFLAGTKLLNH